MGESKSGKSSTLGLSSSTSHSSTSHSSTSPSHTRQEGLVALTADSVFQHVEKFNHFVGVSYLNIYQEKFTDLLNPADQDIKVLNKLPFLLIIELFKIITISNSFNMALLCILSYKRITLLFKFVNLIYFAVGID